MTQTTEHAEVARLRRQLDAAHGKISFWRREADSFDEAAEKGDPEDYNDADRALLRESAQNYRDLAHALESALGAAA